MIVLMTLKRGTISLNGIGDKDRRLVIGHRVKGA